MKAERLKVAVLALFAVPLFLTGCAPECVDVYDCAAKAQKAGEPFTCDNGVCKAGSPFPDAGSGETGGGGGETGGGGGATGGGGGATGGGGGTTEDAGTDAGVVDAGMVDAGTPDAGTPDAGQVDPNVGAYIASLSAAQAFPASSSTETGSGTFAVTAIGDGGYSLAATVTHSMTGGGITGGLDEGFAGFAGTTLAAFTSFASPITQTIALTPAQAANLARGGAYVTLTKANAEIRGQIIPAGNSLWTAQLETSTPGASRGGAQFVVPADGGAVSYYGTWTSDVVATASHIHQGGAGGTSGSIVGLSVFADAGGFSGTFPRVDVTTIDTDGGLYVNVHTAAAPNGLIRGQIVRH